MGFGTGLNALLAAEYATNHKQSLYFESVENDPLASSIHAELGYASLFPDLENEAARMELLQEYWDTPQNFSSYFNYYKKLNFLVDKEYISPKEICDKDLGIKFQRVIEIREQNSVFYFKDHSCR